MRETQLLFTIINFTLHRARSSPQVSSLSDGFFTYAKNCCFVHKIMKNTETDFSQLKRKSPQQGDVKSICV